MAMEIKTKDAIVRKVLKKMDKRSLIGQRKYGDTMESEIKEERKVFIISWKMYKRS